MNLRKDGETIQITSQSEDILMSSVLLLMGFPVIVYKLSNLYFHRKGVFKKLNIQAFSVKQNGLPKNAKGNRCSLFHKHTDWRQKKNYIQNDSPDKLSKTGNHLNRTKLQGLPSNCYLVNRCSWLLGLLLSLATVLS